MKAADLIKFRDAVVADINAQYTGSKYVDYIGPTVGLAIETHSKLLGWQWWADGPAPIEPKETK